MALYVCSCGCKTNAEEHKIIHCDVCKKPFLNSCVDLTNSDIRTIKSKKGLSWSCRNCNVLSNDISELREAILSLRNEISKKNVESINDTVFEELIRELGDRNDRKQNIILFNLDEPENPNSNERILHDLDTARAVLQETSAVADVVNITVNRLGRFNANRERNRPLRIGLSSVGDVHKIIKSAKNLQNSAKFSKVKIAMDKTPRQLSYYKKVKTEMENRIQQGEAGLVIRYQRGIPTIRNLN